MATNVYDFEVKDLMGKTVKLSDYKGKVLLFVNIASRCGQTPQLDALENLYEKYRSRGFEVLAFPSNEFGNQEKGNEEVIHSFCKINYGVSFPLMPKSQVKKGLKQNRIFQWLTDKEKNGWNNKAPSWNFCKYLVDEKGNLTHFFEPAVEPASIEKFI